MKISESLKPGDRADKKRTVGENIPELHCTTVALPAAVRERATRAVASRARDAADAALLLDAFGLLEQPGTDQRHETQELS